LGEEKRKKKSRDEDDEMLILCSIRLADERTKHLPSVFVDALGALVQTMAVS
jgi:hypothetical protein